MEEYCIFPRSAIGRSRFHWRNDERIQQRMSAYIGDFQLLAVRTNRLQGLAMAIPNGIDICLPHYMSPLIGSWSVGDSDAFHAAAEAAFCMSREPAP